MDIIKKLNWLSFFAMILLMYYLLNTIGLSNFPMRPQRLDYLQDLYANNSIIFNYLLVSSIITFPFLLLYKLFNFSFISYFKYYSIAMALICLYFSYKIDLTFLDLMFCYGILGGSVKIEVKTAIVD